MSGHRYVAPPQTALGACPDCGKQRYVSRKTAKVRAQRLKGLHGGKLQRAYQCGEYWHLTSQDTQTTTRWRERSR